MTKLINKPQTIPSEGTTNKRNTNFLFEILPKEKETLQFNNKAIDNHLPTFGNLRYKHTPFKVPLKSHLKGLTLRMSKATKRKYFILRYWFQSRYHPLTLGTFIMPTSNRTGFGVKEVIVKLFDIYEQHTNVKAYG